MAYSLKMPIDIFAAFGRSDKLRPLNRPVGLIMPYLMGIMNRKMICGVIRLAGRRIAAPSCGSPATQLTDTTIKRNLCDGRVMFETIEKAVTTWRMDGDFTFSDLTVEPEACGCDIEMPENSLPYVLTHPVHSAEDLRAMRVPDPYKDGRMPVFVECVKLLSRRFSLLTITGGSGPFTLAGELMGTENAAMATIEDPGFLEDVLEFCLEVNIRYLKALIKAGAEVILLGEPTAAILSPTSFRRFSGKYIKKLVAELNRPLILHTCGNASHLIEEMCATGALGISLDGPTSLRDAAGRIAPYTLLVGNLDPVEVFLGMDAEGVRTRTRAMLEEMRGFSYYVAASGCDLSPITPTGNIEAFLETVRSFR
jgi:MtaA/CmuA family methyltransferase